MTETEFIAWLKGYVSGRLSSPNLNESDTVILETINENIKEVSSTSYQLLLDFKNPDISSTA